MTVRFDLLANVAGFLTARVSFSRGNTPPVKPVIVRWEDFQAVKDAAARVARSIEPDDLVLLKIAELLQANPNITLAQIKTALEGKTFDLTFVER